MLVAKGRSWAWLVRVLGLVVLAWLLGRADWGELTVKLDKLDWTVLYLSPPLTIVLFLLRSWRWKLLLAQRNRELSLGIWRAWSIYAIGFFLGAITPGRLGDVAKAVYVGREHGISFERALAGTLVDRILDLGFLACLFVWAIFQLGLWSWWKASTLDGVYYYGSLIFLVSAVCLWVAWPASRSLRRRFVASKWGEFAVQVTAEMRSLFNRRGLLAIGITVVAYGVYFSHTYLLARLLGLALSFADVAALTVLIGLAAFLPISVAGLGTREGVLTVVMLAKNVPNSLEAALAYAALFFFACYVFPALLGLCCWLLNPLSFADLRDRTGLFAPRS